MNGLLVVDDDDAFRALLKPALERRGFRVVEAVSLGEADTELAAHALQIVIVDGLLPDGLGADWLRRLDSEPSCHRVFASGYAAHCEAVRRDAADLGVSLVVAKPLDVESFASRVAALVTPSPQPSAPRPSAAIERLKADYALRLESKIVALGQALQEARNRKEQPQREALSLAHKLHGTAGSYGFAEVSRWAGVLEAALAEADAMRSQRVDWNEVDASFAELERVVLGLQRARRAGRGGDG